MNIKISSKKIPIPERYQTRNGGRGGYSKYRLHELKCDGKPLIMDYDRIAHQTLYGCIESYRKNKDKKAKFVIRTSKSENYIHVWRIR